MYCKNCGNKLNDGAKFCAKCGNKVEQENSEKTENIALASEVKLNDQKENVKIDDLRVILLTNVYIFWYIL